VHSIVGLRTRNSGKGDKVGEGELPRQLEGLLLSYTCHAAVPGNL